jgi:hypothetical protein
MGCRFCASTLEGCVRSLTAAEMLGEVQCANQALDGERVHNIVLMGSGEPMDNYEEVVRFLRLVSHPDGLNIGLRHISVSTCGLVPQMKRFAEEGLPVTLSLSLHASNDGIRRTDHAVCEGTGLPESGTIDLPIGKAEGKGIMRCVREDGQRAVTHYKVLKEQNGRTLLEIQLETGRTHQIRVHFSHLGHPLCGDFMYGQEIDEMKGCALHSCAITLTQPTTGKQLAFTVDDPPVFFKLLEGLL